MTWYDTTLTDVDSETTKVNNGTAIQLNATGLKYGVGVLLQTDPKPGKSINQESNKLIAYGDSLGFENPVITVDGVMDLSNYSATGEPMIANEVSLKLLQQIYKSGHVFELSDKYETTVWRIHSLTGTFNTEVRSVIKVKCKGLSVDTSSDIKEGAKLAYSLTLVEVRT